LIACYDPLRAQNEDRNDHVDKDPIRGAPQKEFSMLIFRISARGPFRSAFAFLLSAIANASRENRPDAKLKRSQAE
jgi:hypothetical protein